MQTFNEIKNDLQGYTFFIRGKHVKISRCLLLTTNIYFESSLGQSPVHNDVEKMVTAPKFVTT